MTSSSSSSSSSGTPWASLAAAATSGALIALAAVKLFSSNNNNNNNKEKKLLRKGFKMWVNADKHEEYQRRHSPIWPELQRVLKQHGVHNYSIFLDKKESVLYAYAEIEDEERWAAIAKTEVCQKWWIYMGEVMPSNPTDNSPKSEVLKEVFFME